MSEELVMPRLSDTMEEGTIGRWLVHEGDAFDEGDVLAEIETDKATMEFQAYDAGTVLRILVGDGESAPLGAPIAIVGAEGETRRRGRVGRKRRDRGITAGGGRRARAPSRAEGRTRPQAVAGPPPRPRPRPATAPARRPRCASRRSPGAWPTRPASTWPPWPAGAAAPRAASSRPTWSA